MNIKELESKIKEIEIVIDEIKTFDYAYLNGKKFTADGIPQLEILLGKRKEMLTGIISAPITVDYCNRMIKLCHEAQEAVLTGQEYELEGRKLVRADLDAIKDLLDYWESEKERIENGESKGITVYRVTARNN